MRIKEIELVGFKSFVDKTRLSFNEGICAIVGPNGCGKSNVVDAIRWCMGEMSAKSLRGSEMLDVIFNGSETRKQMGMAQVSIIFDCEDGVYPAGFHGMSEIQVTRRLFRSGESEYLINRQPCRLKDIIDLFLDTGVGSRSYSVIEQGQIAKVLAAKPTDRRFLIEEAAGISKYRVKKEEALRKIDATRTNLNRVSDILSEISRTVNSLRRQAGKAERYHAIKKELKELDMELAAREQALLNEQEQKNSATHTHLQDIHQQTITDLDKEENALASQRLEMLQQEKAIATAADQVAKLRELMRNDEARRDISQRDIEHLDEQVTAWNEEIEAARSRIQDLDDEAKQAIEQLAHLEKEAITAGSYLDGCREKLVEAQNRRNELDVSAEAARNELLRLAGRQAALQRAKENHEERLQNHQKHAEDNQTRAEDTNKLIQQAQNDIDNRKEQLAHMQVTRATIEAELSEKKARLQRIREETDQKQQDYERAKEHFEKIRVRLESLEEMRRNLEGYKEGVRRIMEAARESSGDLNGSGKSILGVLAEKIKVEEKYETALEAVLGERLQAVLVTDQQVGTTAVDYLKTKGYGRSSFVPLQPRAMAVAYPSETSCQTLGPLATQVQAAPQYQPVVEALLSNVLVVEDLPQAVRLHEENGYHGAFVTLDGELVDGMGVITGGTIDSVSSGILQKKREIEKLTAKAGEAEEAFRKTKDAYHACEGLISRLEELTRKSQNDLNDNRVCLAETSAELRRESAELERANNELADCAAEKQRLANEWDEFNRRHQQEEQELKDVETALAAARSIADEKAAAQAALAVEIDTHQQALHQAALTANDLRQEIKSLKTRQELAANLREDAVKLVNRRTEQVEAARRQQAKNREIIAELAEILTQKANELDQAERKAAGVREGVDERIAAINQAESRLKTIRRELEGLEQQIKSCELAGIEIKMKREHLADKLKERYQVELADLPQPADEAEMDTEALSARRQDINDKIARMGEVNPNAIEEYEEEKNRLDSYNKQKEDLETAIDELKKAIAKINKTSKERFLETFHLVNDKFSEVIPVLFGGGSANLLLIEPDQPLESGVDVVIRPPGKRLQNVNLLSGGEKALSSIGLIFSIFLIKPSPFCMLDEVDAPLDDENIFRFNKLVEDMARHSQVILITHNKSTMECVDTLYGVTMQEKGVSKLVSVRLEPDPPVN